MLANQYHYMIIIGTKEISLCGIDDRRARKIASRWISLFWDKYREKCPGSIFHRVNNNNPVIQIGRILMEGGVVPFKPYTLIENFPIDEISLKEFHRVNR